MYIRAPGPHSNANQESDLFRNPNQFGPAAGVGGDVLVDKGKVVSWARTATSPSDRRLR